MYTVQFKKLLFTTLLFASLHLNANPIRIMLVGDSITYDSNVHDKYVRARSTSIRNGYRNDLWYKLQTAKYDVDFVGSLAAGQAIRPVFDVDNEGHPGWSSYDIANSMYGFLTQNQPDIILLHIGSNDNASSIVGVEDILNEIDIYENNYNHTIKVILALIIDRVNHSAVTSNFNINLKEMAERRISNGDKIRIIDMEHNAGLRYNSSDMADYIHPNNSGYAKMATLWFNALEETFKEHDNSFLIPIYGLILN